MFKSFFPSPKWFFLSAVLYTSVVIFVWYSYNDQIGALLGLDLSQQAPVIGLGFFITDDFLLFYLVFFAASAVFSLFWFLVSPHPWQWWSIVGSSVIIFSTYYSVQVSVAINHWRRPFFDLIQGSFGQSDPTDGSVIRPERTDGERSALFTDMFDLIIIFAEVAFMAILVLVLTRFFVSHYIFRWRTAMNNYYTKQWERIRKIEGASQRVQEDTMRFAEIMENLGVGIIDAVMTLFAFLPILWALSAYVETLPLVGAIPYPLFTAALFWSVFGTGFLALVGIKLPGLFFKNQRVEAAYRKELVYGEDDHSRAAPLTLMELFSRVRKNYFRIYFHYMYFNVARYFYLQADSIFLIVILVPTIAVGAITLGLYQQIATAFGQVSNSFQYLVNSWSTIVELLSVHKRLASFEAAIKMEPPPEIDRYTDEPEPNERLT